MAHEFELQLMVELTGGLRDKDMQNALTMRKLRLKSLVRPSK